MKPAASTRKRAVILAALVGGFSFWWYFTPFPWLGVVMGLLAGLYTFYLLSTGRMERLRKALFVGLPVLVLTTLVVNILYIGLTSVMVWIGRWDASYYFPGSGGLGTSPYPLPTLLPTIFLGKAEFLTEWSVWQTAIPTNLGEFFVTMIPFFIILVVFGRAFCGWLCPFGGLPDLMATGKKERWQLNFLKKKLVTTRGFSYYSDLKGWVQNIKYVFLLVVVLLSFFMGFAIVNIITPALWLKSIPVFWTIVGILAVTAVVIPFMTKRRWWCFICPVGAGFAFLQKVSFFRIMIDKVKCVKCLDCVQECPMYAMTPKGVKEGKCLSGYCIRCGRCIEVCPEEAIDLYWMGRKKKVRAPFIALTIATASALYIWFIVLLVSYSSKISSFTG